MRRRAGKTVGIEVARKKTSHMEDGCPLNAGGFAGQERYFTFFVSAVLLCFGIYQSIIYFGHTIIPISDFPDFFKTGQELLSLQAPTSFKRAPVLGILQVGLSYLVGGKYPDLTAGWLLNALLHPFNLILLWLLGREIIGKSGIWFAIITILNPWVLYMLTEPIVETTLLFFVLLTFYLIFRRSNWCYLFASMASMTRYEGATLIIAAFVMDMIYAQGRRERIRAFLYSALASVPLGIWMLATFLGWNTQASSSHYFKIFGENSEYSKLLLGSFKDKVGLVLHMKLEWRIGFQPLLMLYPGSESDSGETLTKLSMVFAAVGFFFGCIYGLCKKQWKILALLIFFVPYFVVHSIFPAPLLRYHMPIFWIAILMSWFGLQNIWKLIDKNNRVPRFLVSILQVIILIIAFVWIVSLFPYLSQLASISPTSASVPYVAMAVVSLILAVCIYIHKFRHLLREFAVFALLCLVLISNQFGLSYTLGDGQREAEFKLLGDWFVANAKPGEKMGLYMADVVKTFAHKYADNVVGLPKADNPSDFVEACYKEGITYVVWATREGLSTEHADYRGANLDKNIAILREPKNNGPYKFITQVGTNSGYVNIFRLMRPNEAANPQLPSD
jgi:hypothetical protein